MPQEASSACQCLVFCILQGHSLLFCSFLAHGWSQNLDPCPHLPTWCSTRTACCDFTALSVCSLLEGGRVHTLQCIESGQCIHTVHTVTVCREGRFGNNTAGKFGWLEAGGGVGSSLNALFGELFQKYCAIWVRCRDSPLGGVECVEAVLWISFLFHSFFFPCQLI